MSRSDRVELTRTRVERSAFAGAVALVTEVMRLLVPGGEA